MILTLDQARAHLRVDNDSDDDSITLYCGAAERMAADFIAREIFADGGALAVAVAGAPVALTASLDAITARATAAADSAEPERCAVYAACAADREAALESFHATVRGVVVTDAIKAAILLTLGKLYANREDAVVGQGVASASLPDGSRALLLPYRRGWGP